MRTPFERRVIPGGVATMHIVSGMGDTSSLTVTVDDASSVVATTGPGFLVAALGASNEERVEWSTRSGNTFTLTQRAVDGGQPYAHLAGEPLIVGFTAIDFDEANNAVNQTLGSTVKGTLLVGSAAGALTAVTAAMDGTADGQSLVVAHGSTPPFAFANPVPAAHTHVETDVTGLAADIAALRNASTGLLAATAASSSFTTTPTLAALDPVNVTVGFTVPTSGRVLLRVTGFTSNFNGDNLFLAWFVHNTTTVVGYEQNVGGGQGGVARFSADQLLMATPGVGMQLDLAGQSSVGGGRPGDLLLEVWGA